MNKEIKPHLADQLLELVKQHKEHCNSDCGISLFQMKEIYEFYKGRKATDEEFRHFI